MKDFFGDDIAPRRKNRKGVEKAIYFAKISCAEFEQYMVDGNIVSNNLLVLLEKSFKKNNKFYQETNGVEVFVFPFKEQKYAISLIEKNDRYYFGRISTEKEHNEILEEYKVEGENVKKIIINSFTFFYIDVKSKSLVYIGHKNLKNINDIFTLYFKNFTNEYLIISFYADDSVIEKINKSIKVQSIDFQLSPNDLVSKSIDKCLDWARDIESYEIKIKIKHPKKSYAVQLVQDKERFSKIKKPVLKLQDENLNDNITHLFDNYFTIKDSITIDEIDLKSFENIKEKLENAFKKYILKE